MTGSMAVAPLHITDPGTADDLELEQKKLFLYFHRGSELRDHKENEE